LTSVKFKQKPFSINFAFDNLTEADIRQLKQIFGVTDGLYELSFDERPYVVYDVKVQGVPTLKTICFDGKDGARVYKGEGTIQFVSYNPCGHTPTKLWQKIEGNRWEYIEADGRYLKNYDEEWYSTKNEWASASYLPSGDVSLSGWQNYMGSTPLFAKDRTFEKGINKGHAPAPFVVSISGKVAKDTELAVGATSIVVKEECENLRWDSKIGLVTGKVGNETRSIKYSGNAVGAIPITFTEIPMNILNGVIEYQWWYY
jgi:hypothetical protein